MLKMGNDSPDTISQFIERSHETVMTLRFQNDVTCTTPAWPLARVFRLTAIKL